MLESLDSDIDREIFDKILEFLSKIKTRKQAVAQIKPGYQYLKRIKEKNIQTTDKDNLKEDFNNFKNLMINEFESMKYYVFKEVSSFKK